jgi:hypothetical protein
MLRDLKSNLFLLTILLVRKVIIKMMSIVIMLFMRNQERAQKYCKESC